MSGPLRRVCLFASRRYPPLLAAAIVLAKLPVAALPCSGGASTYLLPTVYWLLDNGPDWFLEGGDARGTTGFGHPPFVFRLLAGAMKVAGDSRIVARVAIAGFAALGVYCTAHLGQAVFGTSAGWVAGTFLMLSPVYFTQAGLVRLSIPLTGLGAATVLAVFKGNLPAYLAASCALVLTKEPGVCLVAAVLPILWVRERRLRLWPRVRKMAPYLVPLILFAVWIGLNQWKWGKIVNRPSIKWAPMHPWWRTKELLVSGGQWPVTLVTLAWLLRRGRHGASGWRLVAGGGAALGALVAFSLPPLGFPHDGSAKLLSAALVGSILLQRLTWTRPGVLLLGLGLAATMGSLFALREGLPRYLLPALPFYYILAAGALASLLGRWTPLGWGVCAVALVMGGRDPAPKGATWPTFSPCAPSETPRVSWRKPTATTPLSCPASASARYKSPEWAMLSDLYPRSSLRRSAGRSGPAGWERSSFSSSPSASPLPRARAGDSTANSSGFRLGSADPWSLRKPSRVHTTGCWSFARTEVV